MSVRYIGSKARLAEAIMAIIGAPSEKNGRFIDGFCGTGVVSRAAASRGWNITVNDSLLSAAMIAESSLFNDRDVTFSEMDAYENAIKELNAQPPINGFLWKTYSPASRDFCDYERRYFSASNAAKIDAIRQKIADWRNTNLIDDNAEILLVADLIEAANRVANTAGTYGCFLKKWNPQALTDIELQPRAFLKKAVAHKMSVQDVFTLETAQNDIVYLDPPYTKRQYASYYHIPETIAYNDEPEVDGVSGLRPWKQNASPFCYKTKALDAICDCVTTLNSLHIYLSYSAQGHVALEDLTERLAQIGNITVHNLGEVGRYRPNKAAAQGDTTVNEFLIEIRKAGADRL